MRLPTTLNVQSPELTSRLLGREVSIAYGADAKSLIAGRRVLITGAAGSIGGELVRQVHSLGPAALTLLDHDESGMHAMQLELVGHGLFEDDSVLLCDIRDERAVAEAFRTASPDVVFHAAAHKHLPLLERYPAEGIKTNVFGTCNVVRAAAAAGAQRFVNVSTDKAARPTSVLGATKRLAELVTASELAGHMTVASVRFGNVLGSRGSFLHSLAAQVARGHAITITHPDVSRFFMTIPEASGLVIEAAVLAAAGETYVLDMGDPVRIVDLVTRYLNLLDAPEHPITFTGLRPGEKLHEELFDTAEIGLQTSHSRISAVRQQRGATRGIIQSIDELRLAVDDQTTWTAASLRDLVLAMLPHEQLDSRYVHPLAAAGQDEHLSILEAV